MPKRIFCVSCEKIPNGGQAKKGPNKPGLFDSMGKSHDPWIVAPYIVPVYLQFENSQIIPEREL